jgi:hypothetical protein
MLMRTEVGNMARMRQSGLFTAFLFLGLFNSSARAGLRETIDARAIQWSNLIVRATFTSVAKAQPLGNSGWEYRVFNFKVDEVLDGKPDAGDLISVIHFKGPQPTHTGPSGQHLGDEQIGKSFVMLLHHEKDLPWSDSAQDSDPRTPALHDLHGFILVSIQSSDDFDADALADLKHQISDVRAAEAQFNPDDAKTEAGVLAEAADATEEQEAEHALLEMGPKAADAVKMAAAQADEPGKSKLLSLVKRISPPAILDDPAAATRP